MITIDKKILVAVCLTAALMMSFVATTSALLFSAAGPVENTFTIGKIEISLAETTGSSYKLIPGNVIAKDPKITVREGSEPCWLFVKITESEGFDDYITYELEEGWTHLGGYDGVYYRSLGENESDTSFYVLKDNSITVRDDLTEEKMSAILNAPTLTFQAYAVQSHSIDTALDAWKLISEEGEL